MTREERKELVQRRAELQHAIANDDVLIPDTNHHMCMNKKELQHVNELLLEEEAA